eukprot:14916243-Heterocapsa_arctica.AAC.1
MEPEMFLACSTGSCVPIGVVEGVVVVDLGNRCVKDSPQVFTRILLHMFSTLRWVKAVEGDGGVGVVIG